MRRKYLEGLGMLGFIGLLMLAYAFGSDPPSQLVPQSAVDYDFAYTTVTGCRVYRTVGRPDLRLCSRPR